MSGDLIPTDMYVDSPLIRSRIRYAIGECKKRALRAVSDNISIISKCEGSDDIPTDVLREISEPQTELTETRTYWALKVLKEAQERDFGISGKPHISFNHDKYLITLEGNTEGLTATTYYEWTADLPEFPVAHDKNTLRTLMNALRNRFHRQTQYAFNPLEKMMGYDGAVAILEQDPVFVSCRDVVDAFDAVIDEAHNDANIKGFTVAMEAQMTSEMQDADVTYNTRSPRRVFSLKGVEENRQEVNMFVQEAHVQCRESYIPFKENVETLKFFNDKIAPETIKWTQIHINVGDKFIYDMKIMPFAGLGTSMIFPLLAKIKDETVAQRNYDMNEFREFNYDVEKVIPYAISGKTDEVEAMFQTTCLSKEQKYTGLDRKTIDSMAPTGKVFPTSRVFCTSDDAKNGDTMVYMLCVTDQIMGVVVYAPHIPKQEKTFFVDSYEWEVGDLAPRPPPPAAPQAHAHPYNTGPVPAPAPAIAPTTQQPAAGRGGGGNAARGGGRGRGGGNTQPAPGGGRGRGAYTPLPPPPPVAPARPAALAPGAAGRASGPAGAWIASQDYINTHPDWNWNTAPNSVTLTGLMQGMKKEASPLEFKREGGKLEYKWNHLIVKPYRSDTKATDPRVFWVWGFFKDGDKIGEKIGINNRCLLDSTQAQEWLFTKTIVGENLKSETKGKTDNQLTEEQRRDRWGKKITINITASTAVTQRSSVETNMTACPAGYLPLQPRRLASNPPMPAPWTSSSAEMAGMMSSLAEIQRSLNESKILSLRRAS